MRIRPLDPATDAALVPALVDLLIEAVALGASIGFMVGLGVDAARAFWTGRLAAVERGAAVLLVAVDGDRLLGTVTLAIDMPPNQPHRADVQKMIVAAGARGGGVGAALLAAVEAAGRAHGRTLLVLDTITGSAADRLYTRGGWTRIGEIPDYAFMPEGGLAPTTIFARVLA